jgi:GNAT superfamily N-acetyltransferase
MTEDSEPSPSEVPGVTRPGEDGWRAWLQVRIAALAAPGALGSGTEQEEGFPEDDWRAMTRSAAIFIATAGGTAAGVAAGVRRQSARERGLGAMWVAPWRGLGVAAMLAGAVIDWAREHGCARAGLRHPQTTPGHAGPTSIRGSGQPGEAGPCQKTPGARSARCSSIWASPAGARLSSRAGRNSGTPRNRPMPNPGGQRCGCSAGADHPIQPGSACLSQQLRSRTERRVGARLSRALRVAGCIAVPGYGPADGRTG